MYEGKTSCVAKRTKFGNCVLQRIYGFKSKEITGAWRKLYNQKPHTSDFSSNITRVINIKEDDMSMA
jgi:hypothetical protein